MQILHVQQIKPSLIKISIEVILTVVVLYFCLSSSLWLALQLVVFGSTIVVNIIRHNLKEGMTMFFGRCQGGEGSHFAVYTKASREDGRHLSPKVFIVRKIGNVNKIPVFSFRGGYFKVIGHQVQRLMDNQKIALLQINDWQRHLETGLTDEEIKQSISIFGVQSQLITPSIWRFVFRHIDEQTSWMLLLLNSLTFSKSISYQFEFIMLGISLAAFIIILINAGRQAKKFRQQFGWILENRFTVVRNSERMEVRVTQLLMGDVVVPKQGQEFVFWFGCILAGDLELVVRQTKVQQVKAPLKDIQALDDKNLHKHHVPPFSKVDKAQLKQSQRFLVTEHDSISKNFKNWFQQPLYPQFTTPNSQHGQTSQNFFYLAILAEVLLYLLLSWVYARGILTASKNFYLGALRYYLIQAPVMFFIYELSLLVLRCHLGKISIFGSSIYTSGYTHYILINFSRLLQLQFEQFLHKNKILGFQTKDFKPNAQTIKDGSTYESLLAVVMYLSMGQFDQEKTLLTHIYQRYKDSFQYVDGNGDYKDVLHGDSQKKWQLLTIFPENQNGIRSWLVQYESKWTFVLSELPCSSHIFDILGEKQDIKKKQTYYETAKSLQQQGKNIKIMLFRNMKEQKLRESVNEKQVDYVDWPRQKLETQYQFGTFVVFDYALLKQTVQAIDQLKQYGQHQFSINFISGKNWQQLSGFEHILTNIPFMYGCDEYTIGRRASQIMNHDSSMFVGGSMQNQHAFQVVDLSVLFCHEEQKMMLPADVTISSLKQLLPIIKSSRYILDMIDDMIKMATIFTLFAVLGGIYLDRHINHFEIVNQLFRSVSATLIIIIMPACVKLAFISRNTKEYVSRPKVYFTWSLIVSLVFITIFSLLVLFSLEKVGICTRTTGLALRNATPVLLCTDLFLLLSSTSATLFFVIFSGTDCKKQNQSWARILLVPFWLGLLYIAQIPSQIIFWMGLAFIFIFICKLLLKTLCY